MDTKEMPKKIEELDVHGVVQVLELWGMGEFVQLVVKRRMDGRKLSEVTEGIIKLWKPKADAKKLLLFIEELKLNPDKYINDTKRNVEETKMNATNAIEAQYQTVNIRKIREQNFTTATVSGVEEILKKIVPPKSFLYRNQNAKTEKPVTSYEPMDSGIKNKPRKFFRLSSYEYPHTEVQPRKVSRPENFNDRGYYSIKTNSTYYIQKTCRRPETRTKYKSLPTTEELTEKFPEDHFYEDLCYNEVKPHEEINEIELSHSRVPNVKPCMVKVQELFQSFKLPFLKKSKDSFEKEKTMEDFKASNKAAPSEKDEHIYENSDSTANMYDSIHVDRQEIIFNETEKDQPKLPVEDYLQPVLANKEYSDVVYRQRDDSIFGYIISIFENRFRTRRETNDAQDTLDEHKDVSTLPERPAEPREPSSDRRARKSNMTDRPLPVPVENEPYYMNIDRAEAENLLKGQPDGTFVLRPSSQPNHAYTLTVSCAGAVHNVGVRRRSDGRLALGFARRGQRSFASVTSLLQHHRRRRLLLVAGGSVCGATTLNDTPQYYQTPSSLPLSH